MGRSRLFVRQSRHFPGRLQRRLPRHHRGIRDESGNYDFFLRSDDASELWISTDDTEDRLQFEAEETGCCNAFQEPGALQTTLAPLSLTAGQKYFVQVVYKEGGGGDYAQVAWRKSDDDTPAADLLPIPGQYVSAAMDLPAPPPIVDPPTVSIAREGTDVTVTWDRGVLQTAPAATGPWTDSAATSPLSEPATDAAKFYRVMSN